MSYETIKHVLPRDGIRKGRVVEKLKGEVIGRSDCRLEGCRGLRLHVRWPKVEGQRVKVTYPCTKGMRAVDEATLIIL